MINLDVFYSIKDPFNRSNNVYWVLKIGKFAIISIVFAWTIMFIHLVNVAKSMNPEKFDSPDDFDRIIHSKSSFIFFARVKNTISGSFWITLIFALVDAYFCLFVWSKLFKSRNKGNA